MENYVVSRELAQKLKEAGYPQTTLKAWGRFTPDDDFALSDMPQWAFNKESVDTADRLGIEWFAAPLSDELLEQLPLYISSDTPLEAYHRNIYVSIAHLWVVSYEPRKKDVLFKERAETLPNALAKAWLYCKENNHLPTPTKGVPQL